jgi:cytochrome c-type biogenesis protein CcmE
MKQNRNKKNRMKLSLILLPFIGAGVITPLAAFAINSVVNGSRQATNGGDLNEDIKNPSGTLPNATFDKKPDTQAVIFAIYANNSDLKVNAVKATGGTQISGSPEK